MGKSLIAKYQWTLVEYVKVVTYATRASTTVGQKLSRWGWGFWFLACSVLVFVALDEKPGTMPKVMASGLFLCLALYFLVYPRVLVRKAAHKSYRNLKCKDEEIVLELREDAVALSSPLQTSQSCWSVFEEAIFVADGIMLRAENLFYWLPKASFQGEDYTDVETLVRRKIDQIKVLK